MTLNGEYRFWQLKRPKFVSDISVPDVDFDTEVVLVDDNDVGAQVICPSNRFILSATAKIGVNNTAAKIEFTTVAGNSGAIFIHNQPIAEPYNETVTQTIAIAVDGRFIAKAETSDGENSFFVIQQSDPIDEAASLASVFAEVISLAVSNSSIVGVIGEPPQTANGGCSTGCAVTGSAAGTVAGAGLSGACTGASAGIAAPGCGVGGRVLGGIFGVLVAAGCNSVFCD